MGESLSVQLKKLLDDYSEEVQEVANDTFKKTARESVAKLKNTSPKGSPRRRHYAEGWTAKTEKGTGNIPTLIVYNRTNWQLTHLLEDGHIIRNKKGDYGRAPAHPHIKPVEEWANDEIPMRISRGLK